MKYLRHIYLARSVCRYFNFKKLIFQYILPSSCSILCNTLGFIYTSVSFETSVNSFKANVYIYIIKNGEEYYLKRN